MNKILVRENWKKKKCFLLLISCIFMAKIRILISFNSIIFKIPTITFINHHQWQQLRNLLSFWWSLQLAIPVIALLRARNHHFQGFFLVVGCCYCRRGRISFVSRTRKFFLSLSLIAGWWVCKAQNSRKWDNRKLWTKK